MMKIKNIIQRVHDPSERRLIFLFEMFLAVVVSVAVCVIFTIFKRLFY